MVNSGERTDTFETVLRVKVWSSVWASGFGVGGWIWAMVVDEVVGPVVGVFLGEMGDTGMSGIMGSGSM